MIKKNLFAIILVVLFVVACTSNTIQPETPEQRNVDLFSQDTDSFVDTQMLTEPVYGFLAKPKAPGNYPGVIMIHEWLGLNDHIKEMAKILAKQGYIVLAIDLYRGEVAANSTRARELSSAVRLNQQPAIEDMKKGVEFLRTEMSVQKVASLGWCFGGQQSLQLSLNDELDATVIYYGQLVNEQDKLQHITWPVLGIFGESDTSVTVASVRQFDATLDNLHIENEIYIYPGLGHAFANPSGANYAANETIDAWEKTIIFLNRNLKS